jgi:hypothetical protein
MKNSFAIMEFGLISCSFCGEMARAQTAKTTEVNENDRQRESS